MKANHAKIYAVVRRIPAGFVATYGQVALVAGLPRHHREVGFALRVLPEGMEDVPWHRVVNAGGTVSPRDRSDSPDLQRRLLEGEGVEFDARGRIDLDRYLWEPPRPGSRRRG